MSSRCTLSTDNEAARGLSEEGGSSRTRHFTVKAKRLRHQVQLGNCTVRHVPGPDQKADALTKSVPAEKLAAFRKHVGLMPPETGKDQSQSLSAANPGMAAATSG